MRLLISLLAGAMLAGLLLAACNSKEPDRAGAANATAAANAAPTTAQNPPSDNVRRMTTVELKNALDKGDVIVVDVRNEATYKQGHIKGARLIPAGEIASHLSELPRDKEIVLYCS